MKQWQEELAEKFALRVLGSIAAASWTSTTTRSSRRPGTRGGRSRSCLRAPTSRDGRAAGTKCSRPALGRGRRRRGPPRRPARHQGERDAGPAAAAPHGHAGSRVVQGALSRLGDADADARPRGVGSAVAPWSPGTLGQDVRDPSSAITRSSGSRTPSIVGLPQDACRPTSSTTRRSRPAEEVDRQVKTRSGARRLLVRSPTSRARSDAGVRRDAGRSMPAGGSTSGFGQHADAGAGLPHDEEPPPPLRRGRRPAPSTIIPRRRRGRPLHPDAAATRQPSTQRIERYISRYYNAYMTGDKAQKASGLHHDRLSAPLDLVRSSQSSSASRDVLNALMSRRKAIDLLDARRPRCARGRMSLFDAADVLDGPASTSPTRLASSMDF